MFKILKNCEKCIFLSGKAWKVFVVSEGWITMMKLSLIFCLDWFLKQDSDKIHWLTSTDWYQLYYRHAKQLLTLVVHFQEIPPGDWGPTWVRGRDVGGGDGGGRHWGGAPATGYHPTGAECRGSDGWQTLPGLPVLPVDPGTGISVSHMPTVWNPLHSNPILCGYSHHLDMGKIWPQCLCHQQVESPVSQHHDCRCPGMKWSPGHLQFWCRPILNEYCCRCCLYQFTLINWWSLSLFFFYIPEAGFGLQVLSLPASVCVCVRLSVCKPFACPHDNLWPIQTRITKLGQEAQNTLVKICIVFGDDWPWPSSSNFRKPKFTPFRACPHHNSPPIQPRIIKIGPEVQNSLV